MEKNICRCKCLIFKKLLFLIRGRGDTGGGKVMWCKHPFFEKKNFSPPFPKKIKKFPKNKKNREISHFKPLFLLWW